MYGMIQQVDPISQLVAGIRRCQWSLEPFEVSSQIACALFVYYVCVEPFENF